MSIPGLKSGLGRQQDQRRMELSDMTDWHYKKQRKHIKPDPRIVNAVPKDNPSYIWDTEKGNTINEKIGEFVKKHRYGGKPQPALIQGPGGGGKIPVPGMPVEIPIVVPQPIAIDTSPPDYGSFTNEQKASDITSGRFSDYIINNPNYRPSLQMLGMLDRWYGTQRPPVQGLELTSLRDPPADNDRTRVDTDDDIDSSDEWEQKHEQDNLIRRRPKPDDPDDPDDPDAGPSQADDYTGDKKPRPKGPSKIKKIIGGGLGAGAASAAAYKLKGGKTEDPKLPPSKLKPPSEPTDPTKEPDGGLPPTPAKRPVKSPPAPASVDVPTNTTETSRRVYRIPDDPNASYSGGRIEETGPSPEVHKTDEALNMKSTEDRSAATAAAAAATDTSTDKSKDNLHHIEEEMMGGYIGKRGFWHYPRRARDHFNQEGLLYNSAMRKRRRL